MIYLRSIWLVLVLFDCMLPGRVCELSGYVCLNSSLFHWQCIVGMSTEVPKIALVCPSMLVVRVWITCWIRCSVLCVVDWMSVGFNRASQTFSLYVFFVCQFIVWLFMALGTISCVHNWHKSKIVYSSEIAGCLLQRWHASGVGLHCHNFQMSIA